jgi:hypothetical protein
MIDVTPSGPNANSYVTVAEADAYFGQRLNSDRWFSSTLPVKESALVQATRWLDRQDYRGERTVPRQPRKWPREYVYDEDGYDVDPATIPQEVQDATCEAALALLAEDLWGRTGLEAYEKAKVGPLDVTLRSGYSQQQLPEIVEQFLGRWMVTSALSGALFRT